MGILPFRSRPANTCSVLWPFTGGGLKLFALVVVGIGALGTLLTIGRIPYLPGYGYSDIALQHEPLFLFFYRSIQQGYVPLWHNLWFGGFSFPGDPLTAWAYPPHWIGGIVPPAVSIPVIIWLHVVVNALGMIAWLKREGLSDRTIWIGTAAWVITTRYFAQLGAGHLTWLEAVAWTPWLLTAAASGKWKWAAAFLGLICLADLRWAVWAGPLVALVAFFYAPGFGKKTLLGTGIVAAGALAISLPAWAPMLQVLPETTRPSIAMGSGFDLPLASLINILLPGGFHEYLLYAGSGVLVMALAGFQRSRRAYFWTGVFLLAVILAFGKATPLGQILFNLPPWTLTRVPPRVLWVAIFCACMLFCYSMERLQEIRIQYRGRLLLALCITVGAVFCTAAWFFPREPRLAFLASGVGLIFVPAGLLARGNTRYLLVAFGVCADLLLNGYRYTEWRPLRVEKSAANPAIQVVVDRIAYQDGYLLDLDHLLPLILAEEHGITKIDGISPMQPRSTLGALNRWMNRDPNLYEVSFPADSSENPASGWQMEGLRLMNIHWVLSSDALDQPGLTGVALPPPGPGETRLYLYKVDDPAGSAWFSGSARLALPGEDVLESLGQDFSTDIVESAAPLALPPDENSGPRREVTTDTARAGVFMAATGFESTGLLVFAVSWDPNWHAWVDGVPQPVYRVDGTWPGVVLPPGEHLVRLEYGASIAGQSLAAAVVIAAGMALYGWFEQARRRAEPSSGG